MNDSCLIIRKSQVYIKDLPKGKFFCMNRIPKTSGVLSMYDLGDPDNFPVKICDPREVRLVIKPYCCGALGRFVPSQEDGTPDHEEIFGPDTGE